jgi:large subunit ribosomal protein L4
MNMQVDVYSKSGQKTGRTIDLPENIFGIEPNEHVVYLAVKAFRANQRQGTHMTKNRKLVRGGGKKPWKQKGRGVARAGTIRSPLWVGGGRVFGPVPHDYDQKVNKKVSRLARKSVLAGKAKDGELMIVEDFTIESGKTKDLAAVLKSFAAENIKALVLVAKPDKMMLQAGRNIPTLNVQIAPNASVYDLIDCKKLFIQESAIDEIAGVLA